MNKLTLVISIFTLLVFKVHGQQKSIMGIVIDENLESIPGVTIFNTDTVEIGQANIDGEFDITISEDTNQLIFAFVGMEWLTIQFESNCNQLEVIMMFDAIYDFMTLRRVDRLRKKRFDKLSEVRKKAFEKGIFKTDTVNYKQEFVRYRD
jgi:hypothetical protein